MMIPVTILRSSVFPAFDMALSSLDIVALPKSIDARTIINIGTIILIIKIAIFCQLTI